MCCFTSNSSEHIDEILSIKRQFDQHHHALKKLHTRQHAAQTLDIALAALEFDDNVTREKLVQQNTSKLKRLQQRLITVTKTTKQLCEDIDKETEAKGRSFLITELQQTPHFLLEGEVKGLRGKLESYQGTHRLAMNVLQGEGARLLTQIEDLSDEYTCKQLLALKLQAEEITQKIREIQRQCHLEVMAQARYSYHIRKRDGCLDTLRTKIGMINSLLGTTQNNKAHEEIIRANLLLAKSFIQKENATPLDIITFTHSLETQNEKLSKLYADICAEDTPEIEISQQVARDSRNLHSRTSQDWTDSSNSCSPSVGSPPFSPIRLSLQSTTSSSPFSQSPSRQRSRISIIDSPSDISVISAWPNHTVNDGSIIVESPLRPNAPRLGILSSGSMLDKTCIANWISDSYSSTSSPSMNSPPFSPPRLSIHSPPPPQSPSRLFPRVSFSEPCSDLSKTASCAQNIDDRPDQSQPKSGSLIRAKRRISFDNCTISNHSNYTPTLSLVNPPQQGFSNPAFHPLAKISLSALPGLPEEGPNSTIPGAVNSSSENQPIHREFTITITPPS